MNSIKPKLEVSVFSSVFVWWGFVCVYII